MIRRALLLSGSSLLLFGCGMTGGGGGLTPAQVEADIENGVDALATGFNAVVAAQPTLIPASVKQAINDALGEASAVIAELMGAASDTETATDVQKIEAQINVILAAAASVPLIPPPFSTALGAISVLLPFIEQWLNSVLPAAKLSAPSGAAMAARKQFAPVGMSIAQAEVVLLQVAKQ